MIIDHIRNAKLYYCLGENFKKALDTLVAYKIQSNEVADIEVDKENVKIKVRPYVTKAAAECSFEAHKRYADIHYVAEGSEKMGYTDITKLTNISYDEKRDLQLLSGTGDFITLTKGYFMIAFPDDAHMPCVINENPELCHKLIAKVLID